MILFLKLAFRNLIRNRTRTILNLTMIIGAFASIVIFRGFAHYMLKSIEISLTEGQNGHIQIATPQIWTSDLPKDKLQAYVEQHEKLENSLSQIPGIQTASGRANSYILLVNGDKSIAAQALGFNPDHEPSIVKWLNFTEGSTFTPGGRYEILVSAGLQNNLQLKVGQTVSVVGQTLVGSMSSLELEVKGIVSSGVSEIDNSTVYIPLHVMQKMLGTDRVERVAVLLKPDASLDDTLIKIKNKISDRPELQAKSWKDSVELFRQLVDFYSVQNLLVEIILACLVFFGILNTLGMSIYERIGELGTLRALGDRTETILIQLIFEGLLLGIIGALVSVPISFAIAYGFSALELQILMPGASREMAVHINPVPLDYLISAGIVIATGLFASLWPAQKAVRLSIVDALRANS